MASRIVLKICMVGDAAVGKSSLIRRFVYNDFDDRYVPSLGAKVSKKQITYSAGDETYDATLNVWDIMGSPSMRDLVKEAYFQGAQGILAVCDATRPRTAASLEAWVAAVRDVAGPIPVVMLANKVDLLSDLGPLGHTMEPLTAHLGPAWLPTSAKKGDNVEQAFEGLLVLILTAMVREGHLSPLLKP